VNNGFVDVDVDVDVDFASADLQITRFHVRLSPPPDVERR